jgi:hypothetical protein
MLRRQEIREEFHIRGDSCTDCLVTTFCGPCSLAQMNMEVKGKTGKILGQQEETLPSYSREEERMVYSRNV